MPGDKDIVRGGIRETDDGNRNFVPGEAEESDSIQGVQGEDGAQVSGKRYSDTEWEGTGEDGVGYPRPLVRNREHKVWPYRPRGDRGIFSLRDVRDEWQQGRQCRYTFYIGMSGIRLSFWRR